MNESTVPMLLVGIGGAGGRIVADILDDCGIDPGAALAIDTDLGDLDKVRYPYCAIGQNRLEKLGTGGVDVVARAAARENEERIAAFFEGARFAILVASTGGGAGAGITPEVQRIAHERNIPTLVFAITPFSFEGEERRRLDARTRPLLETRGGSVVYLDNDRLAAEAGPDPSLADARAAASRAAAKGIALLWNLAAKPGYISLDLATLVNVLRKGRGRARFAYACTAGDNRVADAGAALFAPSSALGEVIGSVPAVAIGILGGPDLRLKEVGDIMAMLRGRLNTQASATMGTVLDPALDGTLAIAILAFESWSDIVRQGEVELPPVRLPGSPAAYIQSVPPEPPAAPATAAPSRAPDAAPPDAAAPAAPHPAPAHKPRRAARSSTAPAGRKDRFRDTTPVIYLGQSLDEPTYLRRGLILTDD